MISESIISDFRELKPGEEYTWKWDSCSDIYWLLCLECEYCLFIHHVSESKHGGAINLAFKSEMPFSFYLQQIRDEWWHILLC